MCYDVRVIRFIKTTIETPICDNQTADYICLGHFDMMHISQLGELTEKPLQEIQADRDSIGESNFGCTENHVYSLYLLKGIRPEDEESLHSFWEEKTTYTAVTRIHCDYPTGSQAVRRSFSKVIEDYCAAQTQESARVVYRGIPDLSSNGVISFESAINGDKDCKQKTKVLSLFYDSLELGDTVSIMKSNSIAAILEVIRCISSNRYVKDTYTYCGIQRSILQSNQPPASACVAAGAELAYISTRFSVRNIRNADAFFLKLRDAVGASSPQFYVTGTADRSIHWSEHGEKELIEIMRALTHEGKNLHYCFNDVITRIGIAQEIDKSTTTQIVKDLPQNITSRISCYRDTMTWLRQEKNANSSTNWKYTLLKLLGTLETMYSNYVMDDLADLLIPSVEAFLIRLNYIRDTNGGNVPNAYDDDIIQFLSCWTSLTNDISLLESQLTQHPELSPIRYYIPAMVLQFELQFVKYCCEALSIDSSRNFVPMLLPVDSPDLYTICPLDPRQEVYDEACPLLVFIPFKDLYRPWETAFRVAHEMAHYCEHPSRKRNERHHALVKSVAVFLTEYWYNAYLASSSDEQVEKLHTSSRNYASNMADTFTKQIALRYPHAQWYLSQSIDVLYREFMNTIFSVEDLEKYLFSMDPEYFFSKQKEYTRLSRNLRHPHECAELLHDLDLHLDLLGFLCAECYADIAMVLLTGCAFSDYYTSVYLDLYLRLFEQENGTNLLTQDPYVMRQVVRMALVIYAVNELPNCNQTWHPDTIKANPDISNELILCSVKIVADIKCDAMCQYLPTGNSKFTSEEDFRNIGKYLSECAHVLASELCDCNSKRYQYVQLVRRGIACVDSSAFNWEKMQQFILDVSAPST